MMGKKSCDRDLTKLKIFGAIYDTHIDDYRKKWQEIKECENHPQHYEVIYYPIDLNEVAEKIKTTPHILHQILYYYDSIYKEDEKHFFTHIQASKAWSINFPLLCVKLGELQEKFDYEESLRKCAKLSTIASLIAIVISLVALIMTFKTGN